MNFDQRLVQEVQQNHPVQQQEPAADHRDKLNRSGEYDAYANLMSERDKQWLLRIQLTQALIDTKLSEHPVHQRLVEHIVMQVSVARREAEMNKYFDKPRETTGVSNCSSSP
ncbi:conserved hypothetical protein [Culex quinquefasciatus]|uniref:Uncharacterized protein n=1 Tax=Culex quinquefasciatus TaxID=7176 RepID=B0XIU9_CULQU|nr:conserved hypothetical protein [Culex quinquefasciatus]|eukprot:XP_001869571.1 conserved hypothetical protein [Culex quinquefasciatus]